MSVDPLSPKYPELTPYQFASNRPIDGIDLDSKEIFKLYQVAQELYDPSKKNNNDRGAVYGVLRAGTVDGNIDRIVAAVLKPSPPSPPVNVKEELKKTTVDMVITLALPALKIGQVGKGFMIKG